MRGFVGGDREWISLNTNDGERVRTSDMDKIWNVNVGVHGIGLGLNNNWVRW